MTDLDQHIRSALEEVTGLAPPPLPVDCIGTSRERRAVAPRRPRLRWAFLVMPGAAVGIWFAASAPWSSSGPDPAPIVELETVDRPDGGTDTDRTVPSEPEDAVDVRVTTIEGRWLSETVPHMAEQLPNVTEDELWAALENAEPTAPYRSSSLGDGASEATGLPRERLRWEGLLFPSTYFIGRTEEPADTVARMHQEFLSITDELGYADAERPAGLSPYEVVIVASIIEAEAATDVDRRKIARVIYNRLEMDMPLGVDTPYYYQEQDRRLEITRELLERSSPYGTRTAPGLPATPISAPGRSSLEAAIDPADGDWIFYVLADDLGNHVFLETIDEFNEAKIRADELGLYD